uniref:Uncharacterized protein n=1 Tax=Romanomermis culicivorax TaxID=13658 RepID=A0A915KFK6_ROMCU
MINIHLTFVFIVVFLSTFYANEALITNGHLREVRYKAAQDFYKQRLKSSNCTNGFYCGEKCLSMEKYRDGIKDCKDGSDEDCWPGAVKCSNNNMCIDEADKMALCISPSDSKYCQMPNVFLCKNRNCILNLWVNDDKNDCGDWSDELSNLTRIRNILKPSA